MCLISVYKGRSIPIGNIVLHPRNSIIHRSRAPGGFEYAEDACIHGVNGDGFGIGWYPDHDISEKEGSCVFKLTAPAWSNINLRNISSFVSTSVLFAHIRCASHSSNRDSVSDENCQPFKYGRYTFMHVGSVPEFITLKRALCMLFDDEIYQNIYGNTDSEHLFGLFLSLLPDKHTQLTPEQLSLTIQTTISKLQELYHQHNIFNPSYMFNISITDGIHILTARYTSDESFEPLPLYYSYGLNFDVEEGNFLSIHPKKASEIIISSIPLGIIESDPTQNGNHCPGWHRIPKNNILVCVGDLNNKSKVQRVYLNPINCVSASVCPSSPCPSVSSSESLTRDLESFSTTSISNGSSASISSSSLSSIGTLSLTSSYSSLSSSSYSVEKEWKSKNNSHKPNNNDKKIQNDNNNTNYYFMLINNIFATRTKKNKNRNKKENMILNDANKIKVLDDATLVIDTLPLKKQSLFSFAVC